MQKPINLPHFSWVLGTLFTIDATAADLTWCRAMVAELSKELPQQMDGTHYLETVNCQDGGARPIFSYHIRWDAVKSDVTPQILKELNDDQIQGGCTNPNLRRILSKTDIRYSYRNYSGVYLGETFVKLADCK